MSTVIHVAGTGLCGSGYPNARATLKMLRTLEGVTVSDRSRWLPEGMTLWQLAAPGVTKASLLFRLVAAGLAEAVRILMVPKAKGDWVYAPYPSIFLLWWLSWVPSRLRPRVIADSYVSLWDAAFRDRHASGSRGMASRLLRWVEGRALRAAALVLVDTAANRDWYIRDFRIDPGKILAIPLAFEFPDVTSKSAKRPELRVLFIGTLVPLHGIEVIAEAVIRLARTNASIGFTFIGDGQQRSILESLVSGEAGSRVKWVNQWQSLSSLVSGILDADICLGVFGGDGKASRVLPYKVYLALAAGKPVVTQSSFSLPDGVPTPPVVGILADAGVLSATLSELAADPARLDELSREASAYFAKHLSEDSLVRRWQSILGIDQATQPT